MIRINLLAVERAAPKKKSITFQAGQKLTVGCSLIIVLAVVGVIWRYFSLGQESKQLDADIVAARQETVRLQAIIQQVQQFEQRKGQLQQRVGLIEQLRKGQTGPVHMLDQISRSLPPMLWLTELKQTGTEITLEGKCATLTGLSDLIANLEASGYFKKSVEIVSSQTETLPQAGAELIKFTIKAQFQQPGEAPAATTTPTGTRQGG